MTKVSSSNLVATFNSFVNQAWPMARGTTDVHNTLLNVQII